MADKATAKGMSAAVLFSTRYGTTEKVARAFETGLNEAGMRTVCLNTHEVAPESLKQYDLICLGGPTEVFGATKTIKEFLKAAAGTDLEGKFGFAFDTKLDSHMSGALQSTSSTFWTTRVFTWLLTGSRPSSPQRRKAARSWERT